MKHMHKTVDRDGSFDKGKYCITGMKDDKQAGWLAYVLFAANAMR